MNLKNLKSVNKDVWLFLFVVLPFFCFVAFVRCSDANRETSKGDCYGKVAQDIGEREGNKRMNSDDFRRYTSEIASRCE